LATRWTPQREIQATNTFLVVLNAGVDALDVNSISAHHPPAGDIFEVVEWRGERLLDLYLLRIGRSWGIFGDREREAQKKIK